MYYFFLMKASRKSGVETPFIPESTEDSEAFAELALVSRFLIHP